MSSSIIEAKFQQLDRTIQQLTKACQPPKVASSDQLRQLVYSQRMNFAVVDKHADGKKKKEKPHSASTIAAAPATSTPSTRNGIALDWVQSPRVSNQDEQCHDEELSAKQQLSRPDSSRGSKKQPALKSSVRPASEQAAWIDPKLQRGQQILDDAWNEIEGALAYGSSSALKRLGGLTMRTQDLSRSQLVRDRDEADNESTTDAIAELPEQVAATTSDLHVRSNVTAAEMPLRHESCSELLMPRASETLVAKPHSARQRAQARCHSADPLCRRPRTAKNWFAPSVRVATTDKATTSDLNTTAATLSPSSRHPSRVLQSPPKQSPRLRDSYDVPLSSTRSNSDNIELEPRAHASEDDPSFYHLELRLEHPESLTAWRFHAEFTDVSVDPHACVVLDSLCVDTNNCLLFQAPGTATSSEPPARMFDAVLFFPHASKPRDLYDHCVSIRVASTTPVHRVVIDTSVHFTLTPPQSTAATDAAHPPTTSSSSARMQPSQQLSHERHSSTQPTRARLAERPRTTQSPRTSAAIQSSSNIASNNNKLTPRVRSGHSSRAKKTAHPLRQPPRKQSRHLDASTHEVSGGNDCSPWNAGDHSASLAALDLVVGASRSATDDTSRREWSERTSVALQQSPQSPRASTAAAPTSASTDAPQQQLQQLRATMLQTLARERQALLHERTW